MKKIMFSTRYGLEQATIAGNKTMTRRIIKGNFESVKAYHANGDWHFIADTEEGDSLEVKPAYEIGEVLSIAQPYKTLIEQGYLCRESDGWVNEKYIVSAGYHNKMFVRADWMPHRIRITGIKAERLQDISEEDCLREGIVKTDCVAPYGFPVGNGKWKNYRTPQDAFACLIDKISGKGTWNCNPWVFAYEFELLK